MSRFVMVTLFRCIVTSFVSENSLIMYASVASLSASTAESVNLVTSSEPVSDRMSFKTLRKGILGMSGSVVF